MPTIKPKLGSGFSFHIMNKFPRVSVQLLQLPDGPVYYVRGGYRQYHSP